MGLVANMLLYAENSDAVILVTELISSGLHDLEPIWGIVHLLS